MKCWNFPLSTHQNSVVGTLISFHMGTQKLNSDGGAIESSYKMKTGLSSRVDPQKNVINPSILHAVRPRKKYPIALDNVVKNIPK